MRQLLELHRFFCRESPRYVLGTGVPTISDYQAYRRQFARAYVRFMWFSLVAG